MANATNGGATRPTRNAQYPWASTTTCCLLIARPAAQSQSPGSHTTMPVVPSFGPQLHATTRWCGISSTAPRMRASVTRHTTATQKPSTLWTLSSRPSTLTTVTRFHCMPATTTTVSASTTWCVAHWSTLKHWTSVWRRFRAIVWPNRAFL